MNPYVIAGALIAFIAWSTGMYQFGAHNQKNADQIAADQLKIEAGETKVKLTDEVRTTENDLGNAVGATEKSDDARSKKVAEAGTALAVANAASIARNSGGMPSDDRHGGSSRSAKVKGTSTTESVSGDPTGCYIPDATVADIIRAAAKRNGG